MENTRQNKQNSYSAINIPVADFFQQFKTDLQQAGLSANAKSSRNWLRQKVQELSKGLSEAEVMRGHRRQFDAIPEIGKMYFYYYDPKTKDKLPYYDKFPLTIVVESYKDGFMGLNLHYISPDARAILLSKLMALSSDNRYDSKTKLRISYKLLAGFARYGVYKKCLKRYLYSQMRSKAMLLTADEWMPAVYLPLARFHGASASSVWGK